MLDYSVTGKIPDEVVHLLSGSGIPKRFRYAPLSRTAIIDNFSSPLQIYVLTGYDARENVVLIGDSGTGKTHAASATLNEIVRSKAGEESVIARYLNLNTGLQDILDAKYFRNEEKYSSLLNKTLTADVLVLDDLLQLPGTPGAKDLVFRIYEHRYAANLPTITTLNLKTGYDQKVDTSKVVSIYDEPFSRRLLDSAKKYTLIA